MRNYQNARDKILELCSEDDYGIWELFWDVSPFFEVKKENKSSTTIFTQLIKDLLNEKLIVPKAKNKTTDQLEVTALDEGELANQLKNINQPTESFYWFGLK